MTLDRAWTRRPLVSEAHIGRLLPPEWLESEVTFVRPSTMTDNGHGGLTGGPSAYTTMTAHVEVVLVNRGFTSHGQGDLGPMQKHLLRVYVPWDFTGDAPLPKQGDRILWVADTGRQFDLAIMVVVSPENLGNHLEIETEGFD